MNEIKFRVWNKDTKSFNYWGFDAMGYPGFSGIATGGSNTINWCRNDSEQYTGLKDKNGKDIYNGDIVRFDHIDYLLPDEETGGLEFDDDSCQESEVKDDGEIIGDFGDWSRWLLRYAVDGDYIIEIIGNIHEGTK